MPDEEIQRLRYSEKFRSLQNEAFQTWFEELVKELHLPGACQAIRKTSGDGGLDSFVIDDQLVYQVFAPARTDEMRDGETAGKVRADFAKAMRITSGNLREWVFLHNHPEAKIGKLTAQALSEIKGAHPSVSINVLDRDSLWRRLQQLSPDRLAKLFGDPLTSATVLAVQMADLEPVLDYIRRLPLPLRTEGPGLPSLRKLEFNELSPDVREEFAHGRLRERLVENYFTHSSRVVLGEKIATAFRERYAELRATGAHPDRVFEELMAFAGYYEQRTAVHRAAALAVLVYYFERCDIFDNPPPDFA